MKKSFTISEVLITLVIIGIIAAITIPVVSAEYVKRERNVKFKKFYSVLTNAFNKAASDAGIIGDNTAITTPGNTGLDTAKKLSQYINVMKICENKNQVGCFDYYSTYRYANKEKANAYYNTDSLPLILTTDGMTIMINQKPSCHNARKDCVTDKHGVCQKDSDGNIKYVEFYDNDCAAFFVDINGSKKPNTFGKDLFLVYIDQYDILLASWEPYGGNIEERILTNKD